jgi:hypothetical protein
MHLAITGKGRGTYDGNKVDLYSPFMPEDCSAVFPSRLNKWSDSNREPNVV